MEKLYLFVLGRDPELSRIEIECLMQTLCLEYEIIDSNDVIAVLKLNKFDKEIIYKLGGTIKIAEVISNTNKIEEIEGNLENSSLYAGTKNKITYYISAFNTNLLSFLEDFLKDYFKRIKLKALYRKISTPSSLAKKENHEETLDLVIYKNFIGKTISVFNPLELKRRDLQRPSVDYMKTISIRLAKILINLSKVKENETLLDPFCGTATILQEALLNNINVIGIDGDKESIKQSKENLEWLKNNYKITAQYKLFNLDSRKLASAVSKVDAIVTEPYLGPYIRKLPSVSEAKEIVSELTGLYSSVLNQASKVLSKDKRLVILFPRFKTRENKTVFLDINSLAATNSFYLAYKPIIYAYRKSRLIREICILERQ